MLAPNVLTFVLGLYTLHHVNSTIPDTERPGLIDWHISSWRGVACIICSLMWCVRQLGVSLKKNNDWVAGCGLHYPIHYQLSFPLQRPP